jgi:putative membrane protein
MQFLKTIFWVVIAVILVVFSISNWTSITITLWSGLLLQTYLPVVIFAAFLLGLVPYFLLHRATRWTLQRKLTQVERQLAETRALLDPQPTERPAPGAIPPSAAPIAVPPGVS